MYEAVRLYIVGVYLIVARSWKDGRLKRGPETESASLEG
jgi:hypothetical protein